MAYDAPDQILHASLVEILSTAAAPMPLWAVFTKLDERGRLDYLRQEGVPEDELAAALVEEIAATDEFWLDSDDKIVGLADQLTHGMVLTHRLGAEELEAGDVRANPDLDVLDCNAVDGLALVNGGGRLVTGAGPAARRGEDSTVFYGPEGWLDPFEVGDVLSFTRRGTTVEVALATELVDDEHEVDLLRQVVDSRLRPGESEEAYPLVLDALLLDPGAFRRPMRPVGELLEAAGLERRGFSFGRRGEDWLTSHEQAARESMARTTEEWDLESCCLAAFEAVCAAWEQFDSPRPAEIPDRGEARQLATALDHGAVGPAFADHVLRVSARPAPRLARFAEWFLGHKPRCGGALLLLALEAERRGETLAAEDYLRRALRIDPAYGPAALELSVYEVDRGDLRKAVALLRHSDLAPDEERLGFLEDLVGSMDRHAAQTGRNDPCPCGSGRKFKACCQASPELTPADRFGLLLYRLSAFAERPHRKPHLVGVAASACDPDDYAVTAALLERIEDPVVLDLAIWEGGLAAEYLEERGVLLPAEDRRLLELSLAEPRRLCEVTHVRVGEGFSVRDTATGDTFEVTDRRASAGCQPGDLLLVRLGPLQGETRLIGLPITVPLRRRESALRLIDEDAGVDEWAAWYGSALALPRLVSSDGRPLVLCEAELTTSATGSEVEAALDYLLERSSETTWDDLGEGESVLGGRRIHGHVELDNGVMRLRASTEERFESLLSLIVDSLPDVKVVSEERTDARAALRRPRLTEEYEEDTPVELPPEVDEQLSRFIRAQEIAWLDESIPALKGLTPRQAAADPTRREDLLLLLREFERTHLPEGTSRGFDAGRLRQLLDID